jgi:UDP-glucuronate 4-epimerase
MRDMIGFVEKHAGAKLAIDRKPPAPGDAPTTWASVERAEKLLGWRPEVRLEEGVKRTVEWARKARVKHPEIYG